MKKFAPRPNSHKEGVLIVLSVHQELPAIDPGLVLDLLEYVYASRASHSMRIVLFEALSMLPPLGAGGRA